MVAKPRSSHARISTFGAPSAAFGARYGSQSGTESRMSDEILPLKWRAITRLLLLTPTNEGRRTPARRRTGDATGRCVPATSPRVDEVPEAVELVDRCAVFAGSWRRGQHLPGHVHHDQREPVDVGVHAEEVGDLLPHPC